jgi:hypothetical protein
MPLDPSKPFMLSGQFFFMLKYLFGKKDEIETNSDCPVETDYSGSVPKKYDKQTGRVTSRQSPGSGRWIPVADDDYEYV